MKYVNEAHVATDRVHQKWMLGPCGTCSGSKGSSPLAASPGRL